MPQTASAKKRLRQNVRLQARNKAVKSRLATLRRRFTEALGAGDLKKAAEMLRVAQKAFDQAGAKRVIHKNAAARKVSRMSTKLAAAKAGRPATATQA
jgi:small subunit ribosomal protein S20